MADTTSASQSKIKPEVRQFVDEAFRNANGKISMHPTSPTDPYSNSEFFQIRLACSINQPGENILHPGESVIPKNLDVGQVCDAVLEKAAQQEVAGMPITDPRHLLAMPLFAMLGKGYTKNEDSGRSLEEAAELGAAIYAATGKGNPLTAYKFTMVTDRPGVVPVGVTSVNFTSFKGMVYDAAFAGGVHYYIKNGTVTNDVMLSAGKTIMSSEKLATECHIPFSNATYDECRLAGLAKAFDFSGDLAVKTHSKGR